MNEVELGAGVFFVLIATGFLAGVVSWWTLRRWSDPVKVRSAVNRIVAHLLELRLFGDEPLLVIRAQSALLAANGALLRQVIGPSLLLLVPFAVLFLGMDAEFGLAPLQPGRPAVITLQWKTLPQSLLPNAELRAPAGIQVETPPVRVRSASQTSWRVRPLHAVAGELSFLCNGRFVSKSVSSARGIHWLSNYRAGSIIGFLRYPSELPFFDGQVKSISVRYPAATVLGWNWLVWFSLGSLAGAGVAAIAWKRLASFVRTPLAGLRY